MPKPTKPSLANVIKERAQRPDFLPKSFIEDNNRLADETLTSSHASTLPREDALTRERAHINDTAVPAMDGQGSVSRTGAPTRPRSYAKAVLDEMASDLYPTPPAAEMSLSPTISPYRRSLKRVATYLADPAKDQLRVLCFNERISEEDLMREAIDMLFKQRGLPQIAFQGAPSRKSRKH